jgi:hypothetical protein
MDDTAPKAKKKKLSLAALLRLALRCDARARRASQRRRIRNTGPFVSGRNKKVLDLEH